MTEQELNKEQSELRNTPIAEEATEVKEEKPTQNDNSFRQRVARAKIRANTIKWTIIVLLLIAGLIPWINPDAALLGVGEQIATWTGVKVAPTCPVQANSWGISNE